MSVVVEPGQPGNQVREAAQLWWVWLVVSLLCAVVGVIALVWPNETLEVLAIVFGINLLLLGALQLGMVLAERRAHRTAEVLIGALALVAGLVVIRHPGQSVTVLALAIGIFLVVAGCLQLVAATAAVEGRGMLIVVGLLDLAIGIVLVAWPDFGVTTLGVVLGISFLLRAAVTGATGLILRRARHAA